MNKEVNKQSENCPLITVRNKDTGEISRVYFDGTIDGFDGFTVMNFATPYIRNLLHQLSEHQFSEFSPPRITA